MSDLSELRESDDPRTSPEAPYTEEYEHLGEKWPDEAGRLQRYLVTWKETRGIAHRLVECRGHAKELTTARKWAQEMSVQDQTSGELAWVLFDDGEEEETVDVWSEGFWMPPHHWTKDGAPPRQPAELR